MPGAILRIRRVELVGPHSLRLEFSDGASGSVDLLNELSGPIFEPLRDPSLFSQVVLDPIAGTVAWPNGADFAPEFLRGLLKDEAGPRRRRVRSSRR